MNAPQIVDHLLADAGGDAAQAWRVLAGWLEDQIIMGVPPHLRRILGAVREELSARSNRSTIMQNLAILPFILFATLSAGCDVSPTPDPSTDSSADTSTGGSSGAIDSGSSSSSTGADSSSGDTSTSSSGGSSGSSGSDGSSSGSTSSGGEPPACAGDPCDGECGPGLACVEQVCVVPCEVLADCPIGSDECGPVVGTPILLACLAGDELVGRCG